MASKQTWRMINGEAILCSLCTNNKQQKDGSYICVADNEICVFKKTKIDSQKSWEDFHQAYREYMEEKE